MKHDKSVAFLSIFGMSSPRRNAKSPYWKISGDGWRFYSEHQNSRHFKDFKASAISI